MKEIKKRESSLEKKVSSKKEFIEGTTDSTSHLLE